MRLFRLADLMDHKYHFRSEAQDRARILSDVASKVKDVYKNKIARTADEDLQALAKLGDPFGTHLLEDMTWLVQNVDGLIQEPDQDKLLLEFANIRKDIADNKQAARSLLHDSIQIRRRPADENRRSHRVRKLEGTLVAIENMAVEAGKMVMPFCSPEVVQLTQQILSGTVEPKRRPLTPQNLIDFLRKPIADQYGITSEDVLRKLLERPDLREKLTTVINAINRGHVPKDGPAVLAEAQRAARQLVLENPQPSAIHEMPEEMAQKEMKSDILDPAQQWSRTMQEMKKDRGQERLQEEESELSKQRLAPAVEKRDLEHEQRLLQKKLQEEAELNKYNSSLLRLMNKMASKYQV